MSQDLVSLNFTADDTEMALGSDLLSAALEGYAIAKAFARAPASTRSRKR